MRLISRKQLQDRGISRYLAIEITKDLIAVEKQKSNNLYNLQEVLVKAEDRIKNKKIRHSTRDVLTKLINWIREESNLISFGQNYAIKHGEDPDFIAKIDLNIQQMRKARDKFRSIVKEASQKYPNVFTQP